VTIDGAAPAAVAIVQFNGLHLQASSCVVRGLSVVNAYTPSDGGSTGIEVYGSDNRVYGNYIGLLADGTTAGPNDYGIRLGAYSDGSLIGTDGDGNDDVEERNVVSANYLGGISAQHGTIAGNYIGTDASGLLDRGNSVGIEVSGDVVVGGDSAPEGNVIAANGDGIRVSDWAGLAALVRGNLIGTDATGTAALGNDDDGIRVSISTAVTESGQLVARDNVIAANGGDGIEIKSCTGTSTCLSYTGGHRILGNKIGLGSDGATVLGNNTGIFLQQTPDNIVRGNIVSGNVSKGVSLIGAASTGNRIEGNLVGLDASDGLTYAQDVGVDLYAAPGNLIRGNTLAGSVTQLIVDSLNPGDGDGNEISDNRVGTTRNGGYVTAFDYGLDVRAVADTVVARNDVRYCHRAVLLEETASARVDHNLLTDNASGGDTGIYLSDTATAAAGSTSNCIEDNAFGVDNTTGVAVVLENNWWGSATGPSGAGAGSGDSASANVDFDPWLTMRPDCGISLLFLDDLESGDVSAWSSAVP